MNYVAILVAAVAAFVVSSVWYGVFGQQLSDLSGVNSNADSGETKAPGWKLLVEFGRSLIVASVLAGLASRTDITDWTSALLLGLALWIAFPVVLLAGSVIHENVPWKLAAGHSGDWLLKLLAVTVIVSVWR